MKFIEKIEVDSQDNSRSRSKSRALNMIENLEFWILLLKSIGPPEDPALAICYLFQNPGKISALTDIE
jgi:hypothetical protein